VAIDEQHVALPRLYGAPAYARPPAVAVTVVRPFDPDDLPIEAHQTEEDRAFAATLPVRAWAPGGALLDDLGTKHPSHDGPPALTPRPLSLREIAGRLLRID